MSEPIRPPDGCPGCNTEQVMRYLHGRGIHVEEIPEEATRSADSIACERCRRKWILMPRTGDVKTPVA